MGKQATIQIRTDEEIKIASEEISKTLGVSMSDVINVFLRQFVMYKGFPFDVRIPEYNDTTKEAIRDMIESRSEPHERKDVDTVLRELRGD